MIEIQTVILRNLLNNDEYLRRTIPYIKSEYFTGVYSKLFNTLVKYVAKYNKLPSEEAFVLGVQDDQSSYSEDDMFDLNALIQEVYDKKEVDNDWLINETEKWCQDRAVYIAVMKSITIINSPTEDRGSIPGVLQDALSVCFNAYIGHDYLDNWDKRYEYYHEDIDRMPFDIDYLNRITGGGLIRKTLVVLMAGTGVGKSLSMCHMAASYLAQGYNALYITAEMSEERIAERIDGNLFDIPIDQLSSLSKEMFKNNINNIIKKTAGKLIIKEYPTGQAHSGHIRALLNELKLKKNFTPDVIFVDYLNIFASARIRSLGGSINSYTFIKAIAEEMRGLAVEFNVPLVTATQVNRTGFSNSDPELEDTSESFGLPATADLFLALSTNEDLIRQNQMMVKQLKNRYCDPNKYKRFFVGVDYSRMKLYDIPESQQTAAREPSQAPEEDVPVFDKTEFGSRRKQEGAYSGIAF